MPSLLSNLLTLFTLITTHAAIAEPVFKSVDERGAITYGDRPADGAILSAPVTLEPGPSDAAITQAREQAAQAIQSSDEMAAARADAERARAQAARDRRSAQPAGPAWADYPYPPPSRYGSYPAWPTYPAFPPRPPRPGYRFPPEWEGPGDHPAFRPGHRPVRPVRPPRQVVLPAVKQPVD
jgi:hypothetical protein